MKIPVNPDCHLGHRGPLELNESQLIGLLTGNKSQATQLGCWDSIKNFFVRILNSCFCLSLHDKEKCLSALYDSFHEDEIVSRYQHKNTPIPVSFFWQLFEEFLEIYPAERVSDIQLQINTELMTSASPSMQIILDGKPLPAIQFANHNREKFNMTALCHTFLKVVDVGCDIYDLNRECLDPRKPDKILFLPQHRVSYYNNYVSQEAIV